ncbi:pyruvate dehydrogenase [Chlorella sorokiniana]|uniref:Pyruvate dehydrogenase n=1 Tax=Chlorella sorokiniana TaxID=3076 RepID=A0A2P6TDQ1_CHLSO|nr:pyruvate dehydrogenase [Chlorella sorokiniana]|eukprot:PRW20759.1 pyruvate dehydrogenase [Chlorella sorokiniana]
MRNLWDHVRLFDNTYAVLRGKLAIGGHIVDRALGLRGKRTMFGQQLATLVIPGVLEVRAAPWHSRATTELYGRVSAADAKFEVALDMNTGFLGVTFGTDL